MVATLTDDGNHAYNDDDTVNAETDSAENGNDDDNGNDKDDGDENRCYADNVTILIKIVILFTTMIMALVMTNGDK